ncbi:antibiotic biosynthesis monooxygenase [Rhodobacteraceae bacterium]|nr:antibiotic biosynthesis monooxygenase [Paracoccaceae bacterium]
MPVHLFGQLKCTSEAQCAAVRVHLPTHISLSRAEPGCLNFEVIPGDDPMIWLVRESFLDRPSFEAHQARMKGSAWAEATVDIEREYQVIED